MATKSGSGTLHGGTVRLTLSAKVANDLTALQEGLRDLAGRLGHPACATGCDIFHIGLEREFTLGSASELNPQPLPPIADNVSFKALRSLPQDPVPMHAINVSVPAAVLGNIDNLNRVVATVLGKLGCSQCCSGFDIAFRREIDSFTVDEKLNVQGLGNFR